MGMTHKEAQEIPLPDALEYAKYYGESMSKTKGDKNDMTAEKFNEVMGL